MNRCVSCKINILDDIEYCPLCHTVLETDNTEYEKKNYYPDIPENKRKFTIILRIYLFVGLVATIICAIVNIQLDFKHPWALIVGVSIAYVYLFMRLLHDKYAGYMKRIIMAILYGVVATVLIDIAFGFHRWSLNYVLPGGQLLLNLALIILMIVNRRNWQSYMMLQIIFILIAILPLASIKIGLVTHPLLSELALLSYIIVFLGTLIFGGRTGYQELKRRFHI